MKKIMVEIDLGGATVFTPEFYEHEAGYDKGTQCFIPFDATMSKEDLFDKISKTVLQFLTAN